MQGTQANNDPLRRLPTPSSSGAVSHQCEPHVTVHQAEAFILEGLPRRGAVMLLAEPGRGDGDNPLCTHHEINWLSQHGLASTA